MTIYQALMNAQKEFPPIPKTRTGQVGTRHYQYADLADVLKLITPVLHKNGLIINQIGVVLDGKQVLRTLISLSGSEDSLASDFILPETTDAQRAGAYITYWRRYSICSALGIVADDDIDADVGKSPSKEKPAPTPFDDIPPFEPPQRGEVQSGNGDYVIPIGKFRDKVISEVPKKDLINYANYIRRVSSEKNEVPKGKMKELLSRIDSL